MKLSLAPSGVSKRRSPILGGTVVADYEADGQRVVVIECAASAAPKPARKAKVKQETTPEIQAAEARGGVRGT
ncbi:MAG: hypothetical protein WB870_02390 [Gallionellaceae bacterium]